MIDIDLTDPEIAVLSPKGALSEEDFEALAETIDTHINETDTIPNLVIRVDRLPHWDSIGAMTRHFRFVQQHHKLVKKVAIVGDSPLLTLAPEIANHFVDATVRRFPAAKLEEAKDWARSKEDDPGHFELIEGLPQDVVAMRAVGIITAQDYRDTLEPIVEERRKEHDKLKCLIVLDEDYATYSGDAAWADMKFGLSHFRDFSRIAMVTDIGWLTRAAKLLMPLFPYEFRAFPVADLEAAKSWIKR